MRIFLCGLATGIVWTVLCAISTWYLGADFNAAIGGNRILSPSIGLVTFSLTVNLAGGIWAMWLYAAIRPRYGAGARTAVLTGLSWWIVGTLVDATWLSFELVPVKSFLPLSAAALPEMIVAATVGAWLYRE